MPTSRSAAKRIRQNLAHRSRNRSRIKEVKSREKALRELVKAGNAEASQAALLRMISTIDGVAKTGSAHKNWASRKKSRLTRLVAAARPAKAD